jgi:hypothetical protein
MNEQSIAALITFATQHITTNMSLETMTDLAKMLLANKMSFVSTTIPGEGTYKNYVDENGVKTDQLEFDLDEAAAAINELLYGTGNGCRNAQPVIKLAS